MKFLIILIVLSILKNLRVKKYILLMISLNYSSLMHTDFHNFNSLHTLIG